MTFNLDANHTELVQEFKRLGCKVVDNAKVKRQEDGQLDVWVGFPNPFGGWGFWVWVEIKYQDNTTTTAQKREIRESREKGLPAYVVRSTLDVENLYQITLKEMSKYNGI